MTDEAMWRLLDYNRRRYWLENGWSIRFRIAEAPVSLGRPNGIKYSFTLHDIDGTRLLGFDNAHGVPQATAFDHRHRFRRTQELVRYNFVGADELLCDFFNAVAQACRQEDVAFDFVDEDIELEDDDEADESD